MANEFKVKHGLATPTGPVINSSGEWVGAAIPNNKLVNSSISINGQSVSLGGTISLGESQGQGSTSWLVKTSNYTATSGDKIIANTSAGSFTITLPASPSSGDYVTITDGNDWSVNNLTVVRNGSTLEDIDDNVIIDVRGITVDFIYNGSTWQITGNIGQVGPTGPAGSAGPTGAIGPTGPGGGSVTVSANTGLAISNSELSTIYNSQVSDSVVSVAVGGATELAASEWKTKNIVQVLDAILFPDVLPTYTIPTAIVTGTQSGTKEIGSSISQDLTITAVENDAGIFTELVLLRGATTLSTSSNPSGTTTTAIADQFGYADPNNPNLSYSLNYTDSFTVVAGTTTWNGTGTYQAGSAKKNNKGVTDARSAAVRSTSAPQASGTITSNSVTVTGIYPYFWGKSASPITANEIASAIAAGTANKVVSSASSTVSITYNASSEYIWMAHAATFTEKTKWYNTELNQGDIGADNFILSPATQSVTSPNNYWSNVSFKVYISDYASTTSGAIEFRNS